MPSGGRSDLETICVRRSDADCIIEVKDRHSDWLRRSNLFDRRRACLGQLHVEFKNTLLHHGQTRDSDIGEACRSRNGLRGRYRV